MNVAEPTQLVKVLLPLDPSEWHGSAGETVWAQPAGAGAYRIDNTPFYCFGLSCGDVIDAERDSQGELVFRRVRERSGHSTYRLMLDERHPERFERRWKAFVILGCRGERGPGHLFAVDVPPEADIYEVYGLLEAGERAGTWEFEEGHCGHPLVPRA